MKTTKLLPLVAALAACGSAVEPQTEAATAALAMENDCAACHVGFGAGNQDVDDYVFGNAIVATIDAEDWFTYGHGATPPYAQSGNAAAAFVQAGACLYCHAPATALVAGGPSAAHNDLANPFMLVNDDWNGRGKIGVCLACHDAAATGYDPDGAGVEIPLRTATTRVGATHFGPSHTSTGDGGQYCWDCHDPHGDFNYTVGSRALAFMFQEVPVKNHDGDVGGWGIPSASGGLALAVDFNKASGSNATGFDWGDFVDATATNGTFNGVCQVCHTSPTVQYFRQTLYTQTHNVGAVCTSCHLHEQPPTRAFDPAGPPQDTTPPAATVASPTDGAFFRGTTAVTAAVSDDMSGVSRAELWIVAMFPTETLVSTVVPVNGTAAFALDTTARADGKYVYEVRAYDGAGNVGFSARFSLTSDNTLPAVAITSPRDGASIRNTVTIAATASDLWLAKVDFYVDGQLLGTDTTSPFSWSFNAKSLASGTHTLTAVASDRAGNAATSAPITVRK